MNDRRKNAAIAAKIAENSQVLGNLRRLDPAIQIRSLMRAKKLKNSDLAERVGVSEECISRWLKGRSNMQLDSLYKLADALEEPLTILFGDHAVLQSEECEDGEVFSGQIDMMIADSVDRKVLLALRSQVAANDNNRTIERSETYEAVAAYA